MEVLGLGPLSTESSRSVKVSILLWMVDSCVWRVLDISCSMSIRSTVLQPRSAGRGESIMDWTSLATARRAVM